MPVTATTAESWKALADDTRRTLLSRVTAQPSGVTDLAKGLPMSRPAVSQHLKVLLDAGLVDVHKRGRQRIYTARPDGLAAMREELDAFWSQALANFKDLAESHPEENP